jgi:hypothetical protein
VNLRLKHAKYNNKNEQTDRLLKKFSVWFSEAVSCLHDFLSFQIFRAVIGKTAGAPLTPRAFFCPS